MKENFNLTKSVLSISTKILKKNPAIFYPFVLISLFEFLALEIIFLSPRKPLSFLLGPPISRIWDAMYLHYPFNFLLMPKLVYYGQLIISVFIGGFLSAVAILMIQSANQDKTPNFKVAFKNSLSKYIYVFFITFIVIILLLLLVKFQNLLILKVLASKAKGIIGFIVKNWARFFTYINFLLAVLIQTIFIFCLPAIMIEKRSFWSALKRNFSLLKSLFLSSFLLILIPSIVFLPVILLKDNLNLLMNKFFPEIVLVIIILGILLAIIIDAFITTAITVLFLLKKDTEA